RYSNLRLQLATVATQAGDLSLAEQQLSNLTDDQDAAGRAFLALANIEMQRQRRLPSRQRNWSAAIKALQSAAQAGASNEAIKLMAGELLLAQGKLAEAVEQIEQSLQKESKSPGLWRAYAILK